MYSVDLTVIKKTRMKRMLSQRDLATALGFDYVAAYQRMECGARPFTVKALFETIEALGLEIEDVVKKDKRKKERVL